jgi:hypothetical protein
LTETICDSIPFFIFNVLLLIVIYYINFTLNVFTQLRNIKQNTTTDSPDNGVGQSSPGKQDLQLLQELAGHVTGLAGLACCTFVDSSAYPACPDGQSNHPTSSKVIFQ